MTRMICIGAQNVAVTELTTRQLAVEMQCRRDSGDTQRHSFFISSASAQPASTAAQLPLFEEAVENSRL